MLMRGGDSGSSDGNPVGDVSCGSGSGNDGGDETLETCRRDAVRVFLGVDKNIMIALMEGQQW